MTGDNTIVKQAVLLIGGLDPQGAAGLTADIQTVSQLGLHPVPLVTCLTEQTSQGLVSLNALSADDFAEQLKCCVADFEIAAIKIGLLPNHEIVGVIAKWLLGKSIPVVLDPVLTASSGGHGVNEQAVDAISKQLLPLITLLTPNKPELIKLSGETSDQVAVNKLSNSGLAACLVKGGHDSEESCTDFFQDKVEQFYLTTDRYDYAVRGTGCVLASAIASHLALGYSLRDATVLGRTYLNQSYQNAKVIGPYHVLSHQPLKLSRDLLPRINMSVEGIHQVAVKFPNCPELGIYPVVDSAEWVEKCLEAGIRTIQLRVKSEDQTLITKQIQRAVSIARKYPDSRLFINDHWQAAIHAGAYGVHLGQEDLHKADIAEIAKANIRLGVSTHSYWELARALTISPSYLALGPVYATDSKQMPWQPQGHHRVREWLAIVDDTPLVAIGGIDVPRAESLKTTGVGSVAMISAITKSDDYKKVCRDLLTLWPEQTNLGLQNAV